MAHKQLRLLVIILFITMLTSTLLPSRNVHALSGPGNQTELPSLETFVVQISTGQGEELAGVYIPGILAAPVVQQPPGINGFVSPRQNVLTQFRLASRVGSTGLLAHNELAGENFGLLREGQEIDLIDSSGKISVFTVTDILRYQALEPVSNLSRFIDLKSGASITAADLFAAIYGRQGQVILQTCIQAGNDPSWGRLFVIAQPANE